MHRPRLLPLALLCALFLVTPLAFAQSYTFNTLYSFEGVPDGQFPNAGLVLNEDGNIYGTAGGGTSDSGIVFKIGATGNETVLYSFAGTPDGGGPTDIGSLVLDSEGNLYGTTTGGGVSNNGTVFKVSNLGSETVLYSFAGGRDGAYPLGGLVMDQRGTLYGTTDIGGSNKCEGTCGTVFKISVPHGKVVKTRLNSFNGKNGGLPQAQLVLDAQGDLYGTSRYRLGNVFEESLVGKSWKESVFYSFKGGSDGEPFGGLVMDSLGNLYGTSPGGGAYGQGKVFKLDATGAETVLYSFTGINGDGASPQASVVLDAQGNIYGTTVLGGDLMCDAPSGCGTVFKVDTSNNETVLHSFTGEADGETPYAGLVLDSQGDLYGTTFFGGSGSCIYMNHPVGCGVVFVLTP